MPATENQKANMAKARAKRLENLAAKKAAALANPQPSRVKANWPVTPGEILGITDTDCCIDCTMERCAISGKPYCAHPKKCGLAPPDKADQKVMKRYNEARKVLEHAKIERQHQS